MRSILFAACALVLLACGNDNLNRLSNEPDASTPDASTPDASTPPGAAPIAVITASTATPDENAAVSFDATGSHDSDGTIAAYAWDFDDHGAAASTATATHAFTAPGIYSVQLVVTDNAGLTGSASIAIHVQAPAGAPIFPSTYSYALVDQSTASQCGGFEAAPLKFEDTSPTAATSALTIVEGSGGGLSGATYSGSFTLATRAFTATYSGGGTTQTLQGTFAADFKSFTGEYVIDAVIVCDPAVSRDISGTRTNPP